MGIPTEKYAKEMLTEIVETYFDNHEEREELLELCKWDTPPVKHIFTRLNEKSPKLSGEHREAIKDIFFLYG